MKRHFARLILGLAFLIHLAAFQNCSKVSFGASEVAKSSDTPVVPGDDDEPVVEDPPVICDPFSPNSTCRPGEGLRGNLYYLLADDSTSPRAQISDIITNGQKANVEIQFSQFDVGDRAWTAGFPGPSGLIMNNDGMPLNEWFAFDLSGLFRLSSAEVSGDYQFALFSDDGSIFQLDNKTIIDYDGQHSPGWRCATSPVTLNQGDLHQAHLQYFQGPRTQIALRLLWRPWSQSSGACSSSGGFVPVPAGVFFN